MNVGTRHKNHFKCYYLITMQKRDLPLPRQTNSLESDGNITNDIAFICCNKM